MTADFAALASLLKNGFPPPGADPDLTAELLARGAAAALEEMVWAESETAAPGKVVPENTSPAQILGWATAHHPNPGVRGQCLSALVRLAEDGSTPAIDALYHLAVEDDLLAARQAIAAQGWQPGRAALRALFDWFTNLASLKLYPEAGLPLLTEAYFNEASPELRRRLLATAPDLRAASWAEIVSALEANTELAFKQILLHYPSYNPTERDIARQGFERLADQGPGPAREALVHLFLHHEDRHAREVILSHGYLPDDAADRALFFFLAEAWDRYAALDPDHHLLLSAYDEAGRSLRRRLIEHARHTGQMEWLRAEGSAAGPSAQSRLLYDLTDADWDLAIHRLQDTDQPEALWRLAQVAPPLWSAAILGSLAKRGWSPLNENEREGFAALSALAQACLASPLEIRPKKALHSPADLTGLAVHPQGRVLAAGTTDNRIVLWDLPDGSLRPSLTNPVNVTRALAFSPDGDLLVTAAGDNRIRVFRVQGGQMLKTLEGPASLVRALVVSPDGRMLYAAGFDGRLRAYRFPTGPQTGLVQPGPGEVFGLAMVAAGSYLASGGADGLLHVFTLPDLVEARALPAHADTITHLAGSLTDELVITAGREGAGNVGAIRVWNVTSGGQVRSIAYSGAALTSLVLMPDQQVLAGGRTDGEITLWSLSTGQVLHHLSADRKAINGLAFNLSEGRLYSAASGNTVQAWDLRVFLAVRLPADPQQAGSAAVTQERAKTSNVSAEERKWLSFAAELARWRQRYDIELAEFEPVHTGAFDIEL
jgi:WD40 repeat protein